MERLESITWPRPLAEVLDACFDDLPAPPSVDDRRSRRRSRSCARCSRAATASPRSCGRYRLERSEGLVLRYLTDAWRTLDRSLPDDVYTAALEDVVEWLGELIRATDATLLDEWALLAGRPVHDHLAPASPAAAGPWPPGCVAHRRAHRRVRLGRAAGRARLSPWPSAAGGARTDSPRRWLRTGPSTTPSAPTPMPDRHRVRARRGARPLGRHATPARPAGDGEWRFVAVVDLDLAKADGAPTLQLEQLGRFGQFCTPVAAELFQRVRGRGPGRGRRRRAGTPAELRKLLDGAVAADGGDDVDDVGAAEELGGRRPRAVADAVVGADVVGELSITRPTSDHSPSDSGRVVR